MSLRSKVFSLCKEIQKDDSYVELRALIHDLHVAPDGPEQWGRSDFGYISKHGNSQFYGYLFTDENIETYKQDTIFKALMPLSPEERRIIERGHATLELLIHECLSELVKKYPNMENALNPYSKFKPIREVSEQSYLPSSKMADCVIAFKSSPAYSMLMTSPIESLLSSLPGEECMRLVALMSKELTDKSPDDVSEDIRTLVMRYYHTAKTPETLLFHASCLMVALKDMLWTACQLLFSAFIGSDIVVINNDNIIRIEKNVSSAVGKYMTVLVQGIIVRPIVGAVGNVLLIDCDPNADHHIHDFGFVHAETISHTKDTGGTSKLTFKILDEHLNPFGPLTEQ